jgi:hypothetical protein
LLPATLLWYVFLNFQISIRREVLLKFRLLLVVALLSLTVASNAQSANEKNSQPAPALSGSGVTNDDVSLGYILTVRHDPWSTGYGVDGTVSHYFTRYFGFSAEADVLRSDQWSLAAYGFRGGPTVRFRQISRLQPFTRALFGYGRLKEIENGPTRPYANGFSYVLGAGSDVRLAGPFVARFSGDFENDPGVGRIANNRLVRIGMGLAYRFGGYGH